ncbi:MAG: thrombospondin type 3 repeat-containing protein, partial [Patescibacteria group bacterium]
ANVITRSATDAAGNTGSASITVTRNSVTITGGTVVVTTNPDGSLNLAITGANGRLFTVVLPAGTQPVPPATSIGVTVTDVFPRPAIKVDANLPAGTTKSLEMPKGTLGQHVCVKDIAGAEFASAPGLCEGSNGGTQVRLPAAGASAVFAIGAGTADGLHNVTIGVSADGSTVTASGLLHTVLEIMTDTDNDGVVDGQDNCPAVSGTADFKGCPAAVDASFERHTVQAGTKPGSTKVGIANADVSIFSQEAGSCASNIGNSPKDYATILAGCSATFVGQTDANGYVRLGLTAGQWLLIAADPQTGVVAGSMVGTVSAGDLARKYLQVIVTANGNSVSGKTTVKTGSELLVIEPEYMVWDSTQAYYPYIFEASGDWGVEVSVTPPEGFVADTAVLSDVVASDYKALQFTIIDQGSCWSCGLDTSVTVTHNGKTEKWQNKIAFALEEKFAKNKKLDKADLWVMKKVSKSSLKISSGDSLWKLVRRELGSSAKDEAVRHLVKQVAKINQVSIPEWGLPAGLRTARDLKIGYMLNVSPLLDFLSKK